MITLVGPGSGRGRGAGGPPQAGVSGTGEGLFYKDSAVGEWLFYTRLRAVV